MSFPRDAIAPLAIALATLMLPAAAQDDARTKQLRILCAQLSGDLTDPGGMAAFKRCLTAKDPVNEIRRDNNIGHVPQAGNRLSANLTGGHPPSTDRPKAVPPTGFGRNSRKSLAEGVDQFQSVDGKVFYVIDKGTKLWRWTAGTKDAHVVEQGVAAFTATANSVFVEDSRGGLWREGDGPNARVLVDRGVAN
ncbi:MAG TPA: hypothetical protein VK660_08260, partial [Xanthomonadaceae bacterium]|nr:hypothetical protein [Xanthomonadaceae bacterium]